MKSVRLSALAALFLWCLIITAGAAPATHAAPKAATSATLAANKKTVRGFYELSFNQKKPREAVAKYVGRMYRQHNPFAADGPQAFISFVEGYAKQAPGLHVDIKRMVAEGDLVVTHSHITTRPGDRGMAVVDIFRLENGKIVEHWDVGQAIPEKPANKNTMF